MMQYFPDLTNLPSTCTVVTETGRIERPGASVITDGDLTLSLADGTVRLTAETQRVKWISLRWETPLPAGTRVCGDHWERAYGDLAWRDAAEPRVMPWYFFARHGDHLALYGVKVRPDALCAFTCDAEGITLTLDVGCGSDGTALCGRTLTCGVPVCAELQTADAFAGAQQLLPLLADGAVFPCAPVYGYNNWYYAYGDSSAEIMLSSAKELAALTRGLENRPFLVIDDGWQIERETDGIIGGDWRVSNSRFPDMAGLAAQIRALDVRPGIWMRPLQNKAAQIPPAWYRDPADWILDPSLDAVLDWIAEDIRTLTGWGYELIKHDYSFVDIFGEWGVHCGLPPVKEGIHFQDRSRTTAEILKRLYKTIYDAAAGKALILGCNVVGHLAVGWVELNRTGDDTSGREWARTKKMGVNSLAFRMPQQGVFFDADADCVGITPDVPWEKNRQWLDLLARSGTPLFISVAPDTLAPQQLAEVRAALAIAARPQPPAQPLDWQDSPCPVRWRFGDKETTYDWD
ncbi:MAG: alpha-galactosidase [Clostridia bacterium]|nr:alpha-galactosidase [Clostridia bacterium]